MDCIQAQEIISAALENAVPNTEAIDVAKAHCRTCTECNAFVKTLVAIKNSPTPEPPAGLDERIMAAVVAERDRQERETSALAEASAERDLPPTAVMPAARPVADVVDIPPNPRVSVRGGLGGRRGLVAWVAAAAVVLVAAGVGSVLGIRAMFGGNAAREMTVLESTGDSGATGTEQTAPQDQAADTLMAPAPENGRTSSGAFIVVDGNVYRAAGTDATVSEDSLNRVGSTTTSLISGAIPRDEPVLGAGDPARVFIASGNDAMLAFDRVTTSFEGRTYVLQSDDIPEYGSLATLPDGVSQPTSSDGFPAFEATGDGATGVYVRRGQTAAEGIAFPPGTKPDVSTGWTWWEPAQ